MLHYVDYINKNNINNILIIKDYKLTNNFKLLINLLPNNINIIELIPETIYKFNEIIIIEQMIFNIYYHEYLIDKLKNIIVNNYFNKFQDYKNIILMKTNRNKNVLAEITRINCENLLLKLENKNYINIIPEDYDIFYLALLLMNANKIIFSTGSILYTNKIFFNNNAKLYYII
jgi:hypothetical protein